MSMLIPIFGFAADYWFVGNPFNDWNFNDSSSAPFVNAGDGVYYYKYNKTLNSNNTFQIQLGLGHAQWDAYGGFYIYSNGGGSSIGRTQSVGWKTNAECQINLPNPLFVLIPDKSSDKQGNTKVRFYPEWIVLHSQFNNSGWSDVMLKWDNTNACFKADVNITQSNPQFGFKFVQSNSINGTDFPSSWMGCGVTMKNADQKYDINEGSSNNSQLSGIAAGDYTFYFYPLTNQVELKKKSVTPTTTPTEITITNKYTGEIFGSTKTATAAISAATKSLTLPNQILTDDGLLVTVKYADNTTYSFGTSTNSFNASSATALSKKTNATQTVKLATRKSVDYNVVLTWDYTANAAEPTNVKITATPQTMAGSAINYYLYKVGDELSNAVKFNYVKNANGTDYRYYLDSDLTLAAGAGYKILREKDGAPTLIGALSLNNANLALGSQTTVSNIATGNIKTSSALTNPKFLFWYNNNDPVLIVNNQFVYSMKRGSTKTVLSGNDTDGYKASNINITSSTSQTFGVQTTLSTSGTFAINWYSGSGVTVNHAGDYTLKKDAGNATIALAADTYNFAFYPASGKLTVLAQPKYYAIFGDVTGGWTNYVPFSTQPDAEGYYSIALNAKKGDFLICEMKSDTYNDSNRNGNYWRGATINAEDEVYQMSGDGNNNKLNLETSKYTFYFNPKTGKVKVVGDHAFYALQGDFVEYTEDSNGSTGERADWGTQMFVASLTPGVYTYTASISDLSEENPGKFGIKKSASDSVTATETDFISGDGMKITKEGEYAFSGDDEDNYATLVLEDGTYTFTLDTNFNPFHLTVEKEHGYFLYGEFNNWLAQNEDCLEFKPVEGSDNTYIAEYSGIMYSGDRVGVLQDLDEFQKYQGSGRKLKDTDLGGVAQTLTYTAKPKATNDPMLDGTILNPVFTLTVVNGKNITLSVTAKTRTDKVTNKTDFSDNNTFVLKGAGLKVTKIDGSIKSFENWQTGDDLVFQKSTNEKFDPNAGWLVVKNVTFGTYNNSNKFGIVRGKNSGGKYPQFKKDDNDSFGWIFAQYADNNIVKAQNLTPCSYEYVTNNDGSTKQISGTNFAPEANGIYDVYFNPNTMEITFGGTKNMQFYGDISANDSWGSKEMTLREDGRWEIRFENCVGGKYRFRMADPSVTGDNANNAWIYYGSPIDNTNVNSNIINKSGTYKVAMTGMNPGQEQWISHLTGDYTFILNTDPTHLELEIVSNIEGQDESVPVALYAVFRNGDDYENVDGTMVMNNRRPGEHDDNGIYQTHGMKLLVMYSDGTSKYLVSKSGNAVSGESELVLSNDLAYVDFDFGQDYKNNNYNIYVDWADIYNAKIKVESVGSAEDPDPAKFNKYLIWGNTWNSPQWGAVSDFMTPDKDGWYKAENVQFDGTHFGIMRCDENGVQFSKNNGHTQHGWYYGTADKYYIADGELYPCVNEAETFCKRDNNNYVYEYDKDHLGGHNLVLPQPGIYNFWFNPTTEQIRIEGLQYTPTMATVYFVNHNFQSESVTRTKLETKNKNIKAYAYNNEGVDPNGGVNSQNDTNAAWGGVEMTKLSKDDAKYKDLFASVDGADVDIYSYTFDIKRFPQIIFNNHENNNVRQTRNLRAVADGVYYLDDEFLPSNYYRYFENTNSSFFDIYPNEYSDTPSNTIYVDVTEFTQKAQEGTDISFSIGYMKDGHYYVTTGIRGTTTGNLVTIGDKQYVALSMTELAIPDGTMMNLNVWEGTGKFDLDKCHINVHQHDTLIELENCPDGDRALAYGDVRTGGGIKYVDGGIYTRNMLDYEEIPTIFEANKPAEFWIVGAGAGLKLINASGAEVKGDDTMLELAKDEEGEDKTMRYVMPSVSPKAEFTFKALVNGKWYYYETKDNAMQSMKPAVRYDAKGQTSAEGQGWYGINHPDASGISKYDITFDWAHQDIYALGNADKPDFQIAHATGRNEKYKDLNYFVVDAVANDKHAVSSGTASWSFDNGGGDIEQPVTPLVVKHNKKFAGVQGQLNEDDYTNVTVKVSPTDSYKHYFMTGGINSLPHYSQLSPYYGTDTEALADHAQFDMKAYTAGDYLVSISNPQIEDENGQIVWNNSNKNITMKVRPTIESVGLAINGKLLVPSVENGSVNHGGDLNLVLNPEETAYKTGTLEHPITWKPSEKVCMETWMGEPKNIRIFFRIENGPQQAPARRSVIRREASSLEKDGVYPLADGMTQYSLQNTLNTQKLGLTKDSTEPANVTMQVEQNGVLGKPQNVNVYAVKPDNMPTEIEEIEAEEIFDEVEGVDADAVVYDLNGFRVNSENLVPGVYVVVKGDKTEKILVK